MTTLPMLKPCSHRGQLLATDRATCASNRVNAEVVPLEFCASKCIYANVTNREETNGHAQAPALQPLPPEIIALLSDPYTAAKFKPPMTGLVAPLETGDLPEPWKGRPKIKPWDYETTVAIPTLNTPEMLETTVKLFQLQTVKPYILIIDTGSPRAVCDRMEMLRCENVEIHYIRAHAYVHTSAPVTTAMDLAFALCRTPKLVSTHADVFLRDRKSLAWLTAQCDEKTPVIGWEMSERQDPRWKGVVSHTFTAWWMPTMRKIGATWSFERYYDVVGVPPFVTYGYPDTEQTIDECLQRAGIRPKILGPEPNFALHRNEWFDHARSITYLRTYENGQYRQQAAESYLAPALKEARIRAELWEKPHCVHLGEPTGDWRKCESCTGDTSARVFKCNHQNHDTTTLRECDGCKDRTLSNDERN